jgi:hypothetical protein
MPDHRPRSSAPRSRAPQPNYFARRLGALVVAFLVLLPVAKLFDRGGGTAEYVVKASGDGATPTAAAPSTVPTTPPTSAAPATAAAPATQAAATAPRSSAAKQRQGSASTAAKAAKPVTNSAAKRKAATTTAAKAAPKPVPTTAAKATPKPSPTTTPKPAPAPAPKPAPAPPPPPPRTYGAAEVEAIIRQAWPDDLEDHALAIAQRESKLIPTSRNYCCYGLFAIYYEAGKRLLNSIGVTSPEQLFDPVINSRAAYELYKVAGWDPWKL